jgi:hypothetical protein
MQLKLLLARRARCAVSKVAWQQLYLTDILATTAACAGAAQMVQSKSVCQCLKFFLESGSYT